MILIGFESNFSIFVWADSSNGATHLLSIVSVSLMTCLYVDSYKKLKILSDFKHVQNQNG